MQGLKEGSFHFVAWHFFMGTALLGGIDANVNLFILKSYFKKSPTLQVCLFWAVGTKNNDSWVLLLYSSALGTSSPRLIWSGFKDWTDPWNHFTVYFLLSLPIQPRSDFSEKLQVETRWDVDGVHSQSRRIKGEQNGEHVLVVQQQVLRVIPTL